MKIIIFLLLISIPFIKPVHASIVINEFSSASDTEWIELYNTSESKINLANYSLFYNEGDTAQKNSFCNDESIEAGSYKLVNLSTHWLNNDGDTIILKNGDDNVETISYGNKGVVPKPDKNQSVARVLDSDGIWELSDTPTPSGNPISFVCPSPSPSPTPTPTPTPTPSLSPAPSPSPSPTPSPSPRHSLKPSPSILARESPTGTVAGETLIDLSAFGTSPSPSLSLTPDHDPLSLNRDRARIVILIGSGLLLISLAAGFGLRQYKHSQSHAL